MFTSHRTDPVRGSRRSMVLGRGGMVCTSQPLASFAGAEMLRRGGNAVDAAICAAALLGVVEPFMTGIGGDCFMLIWNAAERRLFGLNGSGRAPRAATRAALLDRGHTPMPMLGMLSVTVPGALDAWCRALERFGSRALADVLAPAIDYAETGFAVSEIIAVQWAFAVALLEQAEARRTFTVDGRAPRLGELVRLPGLAHRLRALAARGGDVVFRRELAEQIVAWSRGYRRLLQRDGL